MSAIAQSWDYLIVTASNDRQASAYRGQLELRSRLGLLGGVREVLVVPDPRGRRVGSGGSTVHCLVEVLSRRLPDLRGACDKGAWQAALSPLRVLIVHAGGDSRRLPAYGPCGKLFIPMPCESDGGVAPTLFDRQIATYLALPPAPAGAGQIVITAGDVLLTFDPALVRLDSPGITGLGCLARPDQAARHGVYCASPDGQVRLFLQKPSPAEQQDHGAIDRYGQSILDIGVMSFDAATAATVLQVCGLSAEGGKLQLAGAIAQAIERSGMDFYREVCCALGSQATAGHHATVARASGSTWDDAALGQVFQALRGLAFGVQVVPGCSFLHFGATAEIIASGGQLVAADRGLVQLDQPLSINNHLEARASITGSSAWVEACRIAAPVELAGQNVLTGMDVDAPLALPAGACVDVTEGRDRSGKRVWFVRCYGVADAFKEVGAKATFCGLPLSDWLAAVGASPDDVWDRSLPAAQRTAWDARLFPAQGSANAWRQWLWMFDPAAVDQQQKQQWLAADRYSPSEIAELVDQQAFFHRRSQLWADTLSRSCRRVFRHESLLSAAELAEALRCATSRDELVRDVLAEAQWHYDGAARAEAGATFVFPRIIHTLGTAFESLAGGDERVWAVLPALGKLLAPAQREWLGTLELLPGAKTTVAQWAEAARSAAHEYLSKAIVSSRAGRLPAPRNALRSDEIVWGRAPARLDMGGGWTDTPPYSLECGGCVINAAVDLNGQPPIQAYARVVDEPVIRIGSIDLGLRIEVAKLDDLLDYRQATSGFALAKAALALSGFAPTAADWPPGCQTLRKMLEHFGGGIEMTTLAAIPKGSGLGTSSIMGVVILAVIQRMLGRTMSRTELFHGVLQLEQALTTGGGWQDQIGGAVDGVKVISAAPGLVPDARIHYVPADVLDPRANGGCTLLYYTGITRLAKNILRQVVGRYLDRDRATMSTLRRLHALPPLVADAMAHKDTEAFGGLIDVAWRLNKELDADSSNEQIESLLARVGPHIHGAKLLGAGGGGFLLVVCKSPADAQAARRLLEAHPPNDRARFFDFDISTEGLAVTVC